MHSASADLGKQPAGGPSPLPEAPDCSVHHAWPWRRRLVSAAERRMRAWWNAAERQPPSTVEAAVAWLNAQELGRGLASLSGGAACPGMTAAMIPTLLEFGQLDLAQRWSDWLVAQQLSDGSFPRADGTAGSPFNTAQALSALVQLSPARGFAPKKGSGALAASNTRKISTVESSRPLFRSESAAGLVQDRSSAERAAEYLAKRLTAKRPAGGLMFQVRVAGELCCLPALAAAAQHFAASEWQALVDQLASHARRVVDWRLWDTSTRLVPYIAEAWLNLGEPELARDALRGPSAAQRRDGAVPADRSGRWGDFAVLAQLAVLWYRLGDRPRADLALAFVQSGQLVNGAGPKAGGATARTVSRPGWSSTISTPSAGRWRRRLLKSVRTCRWRLPRTTAACSPPGPGWASWAKTPKWPTSVVVPGGFCASWAVNIRPHGSSALIPRQ